MGNLQLIISLATLGGILANLVLWVLKPNIKQDKDILGINKDIDNVFVTISQIHERLGLIENNSLKHLEQGYSDIRIELARLSTILEERLPKVSNGLSSMKYKK